jgi:multidrug efflux pump subunit AcrA (membrane-fusion protein)
MSEKNEQEIHESDAEFTEQEVQEEDYEYTDSEIDAEDENRRSIPNSNVRRAAVIGLVGLLIVLVVVIFAWRRSSNNIEQAATEAEKNETGKVKFLMEQQWLIQMKLAKAEEQTVSRQITSVGRVIPATNSQAIVSTPVAGILSDRRLPAIGQYVGSGQTVAFIRQTPTSTEQAQTRAAQTQVELSRSQLESQKAQLELQKSQMEVQNSQIEIENTRLLTEKRIANGNVETARVRLEAAKREADRMQRLFDGKAASQKQLQAAQTERESAKVFYESAVKQRDELNKARPVQTKKVNINTNFGTTAKVISSPNGLTISAPFGGYVTKVNKSIGEQVSPGDAIIEISNLDTVYVEAPIFERDLNVLGGSRTATFTVSAYEQEFKGTILDLGAVIDEQTRAAKVIFQVENAGRALRLGMQTNVRLDAEQTVTAMMIPKEAVLEAEGKKIIYVLLSGEEFERREVTLGDEYGEKVAILSGLDKGERVVTQGAYQMRLQELRPAESGVHSHET